MCPGDLPVCDLPTSVGVRASHLVVSACPGEGRVTSCHAFPR